MEESEVVAAAMSSERVWIREGNMAVACKITSINLEAKARDKAAYAFFELDEPVGHNLPAFDLYKTAEDVLNVEERSEGGAEDLLQWRRRALKFILSTHREGDNYGKPDESEEGLKRLEDSLSCFPPKEKGKDWLILTKEPSEDETEDTNEANLS